MIGNIGKKRPLTEKTTSYNPKRGNTTQEVERPSDLIDPNSSDKLLMEVTTGLSEHLIEPTPNTSSGLSNEAARGIAEITRQQRLLDLQRAQVAQELNPLYANRKLDVATESKVSSSIKKPNTKKIIESKVPGKASSETDYSVLEQPITSKNVNKQQGLFATLILELFQKVDSLPRDIRYFNPGKTLTLNENGIEGLKVFIPSVLRSNGLSEKFIDAQSKNFLVDVQRVLRDDAYKGILEEARSNMDVPPPENTDPKDIPVFKKMKAVMRIAFETIRPVFKFTHRGVQSIQYYAHEDRYTKAADIDDQIAIAEGIVNVQPVSVDHILDGLADAIRAKMSKHMLYNLYDMRMTRMLQENLN